MKYTINETFYSLKGEGIHTGKPMFFIRFAGCNLVCDFCDTLHQTGTTMTLEELLGLVRNSPANHVVLTGGEPTLYDYDKLCEGIIESGKALHIETNGTNPLTFPFDWIACSPKSPIPTLSPSVIQTANELKFLVGMDGWQQYIDDVLHEFDPQGLLYVMPLSVGGHEGIRGPEDIVQDNVQLAIQYCLEHPEFALCMQLHKILSIR